ncbi:endonuclease/exonuclease/phosphatase family protein [Roseibium aggregatum]|uniref:endonuclease/exonuclease/phosphatase family protein n=1 Tax=Roseibium aggregatum TaxID=187304 RepID=UPI001AD93703|nr:endonuclease/exonuclease/phosphatase family protein [Roseibium aggregatum]
MIRLATFNIESFGDDKFKAERLEPRIRALRPKLLELEADILCLQEVNAQKLPGESERKFLALDALLAGTPYETFHAVTTTRPDAPSPGDRHNLVVLSRFPVLESRIHHEAAMHVPLWQPDHASPAMDAPEALSFDRPVLELTLDIGGETPLHLFAVHLRAPIAAPIPGGKTAPKVWKNVPAWAEGYFLASMMRTVQALDLRLKIDGLFDRHPEPLIAVAGDFNATEDSTALRLLLADPDDTGNPDLANRQLFQLDAALPPELRRTVIHKGRGQALDHILASPALFSRMRDIEVFNDDLADEVLDEGTLAEDGSFHAAVRACFEF